MVESTKVGRGSCNSDVDMSVRERLALLLDRCRVDVSTGGPCLTDIDVRQGHFCQIKVM